MIRVQQTTDKCVINVPINPVVVTAATNTKVLSSIRGVRGECAGRYIQNVGANDLFFNYDATCDNATNFVGKLAPYQQQDVSNFPGDVNVYSVGGTTVCLLVLTRSDLATWQQWAKGAMNVP